MTPIALSKLGVPDSTVLTLSEYPLQGLGLYDDLETCEQYSGYVWSNWTTKTVQPAHIDSALQAMIDQSSKQGVKAASQPSHISAPTTSSTTTGLKGSYASTFPTYRKVPKMTHHLCAEHMTKTAIVPNLSRCADQPWHLATGAFSKR